MADDEDTHLGDTHVIRREGGAWSTEALTTARIQALEDALARKDEEIRRLADLLRVSLAVCDGIYHFLSDADRERVEQARSGTPSSESGPPSGRD